MNDAKNKWSDGPKWVDSKSSYDFRLMVGHRMMCGNEFRDCYDKYLTKDLDKFHYAKKHVDCMKDCLGPL